MVKRSVSGQSSSGALRGMVLTATLVVTAIAIAGLGYGLDRTQSESAGNRTIYWIAAITALLAVGVPAAFMWFNTVRVLRGNSSAAWRVRKHLLIVPLAMFLFGFEMLFLTAQFAVLGVLAGGVVVVLVCHSRLERVLLRDRVRFPPPNWHDRLVAWVRD